MQSRCFTELWPISSRWTCKFKSIPPTLGHLHFWTGHFTYCFTHCGTIEKKTGYQDQLKHILVCVLPLFLMNSQRHGVLLGAIWAGFLHPLALKKLVGFFIWERFLLLPLPQNKNYTGEYTVIQLIHHSNYYTNQQWHLRSMFIGQATYTKKMSKYCPTSRDQKQMNQEWIQTSRVEELPSTATPYWFSSFCGHFKRL